MFIVVKFIGPKYSRGVVTIFKLFCIKILKLFDCDCKVILASIFLFNIDELIIYVIIIIIYN